MQLKAIRQLVATELQQVDQLIAKQLGSDVSLIQDLGEYIFAGGGKRLRPLLVLLTAKALYYEGEHHIHLAAIIELIHTATLLHDDVVDASTLRRGRKTANVMWGNDASVLVGDFLYSRAFQMMVNIESLTVMSILAETSNTIASGEVMQLLNCNNPKILEADYMETIRRKTAALFEAAARLSAVIANQDYKIEKALAKFGLHLGIAFQLVDDALDYGASNEDIGKNIGDDLAEGKPTLPLLYVLQRGTAAQKNLVTSAIQRNKSDCIDAVIHAVQTTGALDYTYQQARQQVNLALEAITQVPANPYQDALSHLAQYAVTRNF